MMVLQRNYWLKWMVEQPSVLLVVFVGLTTLAWQGECLKSAPEVGGWEQQGQMWRVQRAVLAAASQTVGLLVLANQRLKAVSEGVLMQWIRLLLAVYP